MPPAHDILPRDARAYPRITRDELLRWADAGAAFDLPQLVRRLVLETTQPERVHFASGTGSLSGGWDGEVRSPIGNAFVPAGVSGWELSTRRDSNRKAQEDYAKRTTGPSGVIPQEVTYVQLICRPWIKRDAFESKHRKNSPWLAVRGYNVDDLETWLAAAPATGLWLAEEMGRPTWGVTTLERWWATWLDSTIPSLDEHVVLAGRDNEARDLTSRLKLPGVTTLGGDIRFDEAKAFVAAAVQRDQGNDNQPPVLYANAPRVASELLRSPGRMILLVDDPAAAKELQNSSPHHVIVAIPGDAQADLVLPPVMPGPVRQVLKDAGVSARSAFDDAALARRSLLALRRKLAKNPSLHKPEWSEPGASALIRRTLLAGMWNQSNAKDRFELESLIGEPYDRIEDGLRQLASSGSDPMVALIQDT